MRPLFAGSLMLAAGMAIPATPPAVAQTGTQAPAPASPCQAEPEQPHTGSDEDRKDAGNDGQTDKLAPCGGVLKPPPTGDSGLTEPAPDEGRTPIIKPGEVPPQAPKQD